ncbi:MAG: hypothetical protein Q4D14_04885 [Bacteroidales bacterium]|nr:hypothetical protein [Bacteroidales bacterium]
MHREVVVGHVVNAIADKQMAKSGRAAECVGTSYVVDLAANKEALSDEERQTDALILSEQLMLAVVANNSCNVIEARVASIFCVVNINHIIKRGDSQTASRLFVI